MMKQILAIVIAVIVGTAGLPAQTTWKIDRSHSRINFSVTHMLVSEVTGGFKEFDGTIVASKEDFTDATIHVTLKTGSINTDNDNRDEDLRSDNFFNSDTFPTASFTSTSIEKTGDNTYKITGNLTIRNITKPVVLNAKYNGQVKGGRGTKAGFKATTTIDRFEFGIKWNRVIEAGGLVVSKDVDLTLLLELDKQTGEPRGK